VYDLAVEDVLADHDGVHARGLFEREEREATRAAGRVAHDRACVNLAELLKVRAQAVYEAIQYH
jgi:hypothetical protein